MTTWALLSDVHGRGDKLARVLADARTQGATRFLALGDIASNASTHALDLLDTVQPDCAFGNWECSGLRGLSSSYRGWVARWAPRLRFDGFWAGHASPVWPNGLGIMGVVEYLRARDLHWTALFPSLQRSEEARWAAFAELESSGVTIFFHGHTHVQEAWHWRTGETPVRVDGAVGECSLEGDGHWLVGVGSTGEPHDGSRACYALYESDARRVIWRRV